MTKWQLQPQTAMFDIDMVSIANNQRIRGWISHPVNWQNSQRITSIYNTLERDSKQKFNHLKLKFTLPDIDHNCNK